MLAASILVLAILIVLSVRWPLLGISVVWFAIWLYPNTLLYNLLPLNIRFDDLLLFSVFIIAICKRPPSLTLWNAEAFKLAVAWWIVCLIGSLSGLLYSGWQDFSGVFKYLIKALYVPMTAFIITVLVTDFRQLRVLLIAIMVAGGCAAMLGVGTVLLPDSFSAFLIPSGNLQPSILEDLDNSLQLERRASGAIGTVSTSILCPLIALLALNMINHKKLNILPWYLLTIILAVGFIGLVFTQSRGPMIGFALASFLVMFLVNGKSNYVLRAALLSTALLIVFTDNQVKEMVVNRFEGDTGSTFSGGVSLRSHIWQMFLTCFDKELYVNGIGFVSCERVFGVDAHNTYLGSFIYGGVWGMFMLIYLIIYMVRAIASHLKVKNELHRFLGYYLFCLLVFLLFIGGSIESFQQVFGMQIAFAFIAISEIALKNTRLTKTDRSENQNIYYG